MIETSCTILDLNGVGLYKAKQVYGYLQEASKIGQNYYPERMGISLPPKQNQFVLCILLQILGKFYLINAPWGFATVWAVIKRWLDPVTVSKIAILGSNYASALLEQIPAENLPSQFGGACRCEGGCELSDAGPWQDPQWLGPQDKVEKTTPAAAAGKPEEASSSSCSTEPAAPDVDAGDAVHAA